MLSFKDIGVEDTYSKIDIKGLNRIFVKIGMDGRIYMPLNLLRRFVIGLLLGQKIYKLED